MHRHFVPFNALGVLCAVGYSGYATTPSHIPWGGYVATLFFFAAAVGPIVREYRRLNFGFRDIETEYLDNRHRDHSPPKQEIIAPNTQSAQFAEKRSRLNIVLVLSSTIAVGLLLFDVTYRQIHLPEKSSSPDIISNF